MAFPKQHRLKEQKIISRVFSRARPVQESGISVRTLGGRRQQTRFVVVVSVKAVPLAVRRNTIRRKVTEALRRIVAMGGVVTQKEVVVTAHAVPADTTTLEKNLVLLLRKSGILQQ